VTWSILWEPSEGKAVYHFIVGTGKWKGIAGEATITGIQCRADDGTMLNYKMSWELEESVFERSLTTLKKFGVKPEGFRAPYWLISDRTIERIKQFGFKYDSDFMDTTDYCRCL
jgi:hypothetical protein